MYRIQAPVIDADESESSKLLRKHLFWWDIYIYGAKG